MAMKFLTADQLPAFLGTWPRRRGWWRRSRPTAWCSTRSWTPGTEVELDVLLAKQSPKEYVFPQSETYPEVRVYAWRSPARPTIRRASATAGAAEGEARTRCAAHRRSVIPHETVAGRARGRSPRPGHLRPAALRRPRLRADGQRLRRLRRLLLRPLLQRAPRGHHAGGGDLPRPALHLLLHRYRRRARPGPRAWTRCSPRSTAVSPSRPSPRRARRCWPFAGLTDAGDAQAAEAAEVKETAAAAVDVPFALEGVRENLRANIEDPQLARPGHALHLLRHLHLRLPQLLLLQHHRRDWSRRSGERFRTWDNCFNPIYTAGDLGPQPAGRQVQPLPQPLQPQVLVLPREVRQPALLGLRALHHALPHPHRHPRGAAHHGLAGCAGGTRLERRPRWERGVDPAAAATPSDGQARPASPPPMWTPARTTARAGKRRGQPLPARDRHGRPRSSRRPPTSSPSACASTIQRSWATSPSSPARWASWASSAWASRPSPSTPALREGATSSSR